VFLGHWVFWPAYVGTGPLASRWKDQNRLLLTLLKNGWMEKMKFGETNPEIYLMKKALAKAGAFAFSIVSLNPAHRLCVKLLHAAE